jgi:hypothetical protein
MNSFYNDDLLQRILILWIMAVLIVYGNNAPLVDEEISAMRSTVGAYMVARMTANSAHLFYSFSSYHHRAQQRLWFVMASVALCVYIPLYFETVSLRSKIAVAAVAEVLEEGIWMFCYSPIAKQMLRARYTTAVDIAHEIDRFAAFYIIALGEFLYTIVVGSPAAVGFNLPLLRAVWTLVIAFCLNWMYVHNDCAFDYTHPIRHSVGRAFAWVSLHLPLIASLLAGGHVAAASAKSSYDSNTSTSTTTTTGGSEKRSTTSEGQTQPFDDGQRWLLCASLGVGLFVLYAMSLLYSSTDGDCQFILPKHFRIIMRPIVGLILVLLPLAKSLNLTETLSVVMALVVFCLIWENVTSLQKGAKIWEAWRDTGYPEGGNRAHKHGGGVTDDREVNAELGRGSEGVESAGGDKNGVKE